MRMIGGTQLIRDRYGQRLSLGEGLVLTGLLDEDVRRGMIRRNHTRPL